MQNQCQRFRTAFDGSVPARLHRIGLADADGRADRDAMAVLARILARQFYAGLCDGCSDYAEVQELLTKLFDAAKSVGPKQKFLMICLQYDSIYRDLPELVLWINRQPEAAELFSDSFLAQLKRLEKEAKGGDTRGEKRTPFHTGK